MRERIFAEMTPNGKRLRSRHLHRVHGAARPRPHRAGRQDLPQGHARLQREIEASLAAGFPARPAGLCEAGRAEGHAHRAGALMRFAERHAELARQRWPPRKRPAAPRRAGTDRGSLRATVPAHAPRTFWEALQYTGSSTWA
jgi:hypothetical protein